MNKASDILAYTVSYGDRNYLPKTVPQIRATAGCWFDWAVWLGAPSPASILSASELLKHPQGIGIQRLEIWDENKGQHHATNAAMALARAHGYKWILRLDDDVTAKTKKFLTKMVTRLEELKTLTNDKVYRIVAAPKIIGLKHPLQPQGGMFKGQAYPVDIMATLGGACRLHNVDFFKDYEAPIYDPVGRGDPESIISYTDLKVGILARFPDIRLVHQTKELEKLDSPEMALMRRMSKIWPYLGADV